MADRRSAPMGLTRTNLPEPVLTADPLADLLLSVAAIVVLAVIVIIPTTRPSFRGGVGSGEALVKSTHLRAGKLPVEPILATSHGLIIDADRSAPVPVDQILDSQRLISKLEHMRDTGEPLVLLIDPDGFEAAFLFGTMASAHGPSMLRQVRLDPTCTHVRTPAILPGCNSSAAGVGGRT